MTTSLQISGRLQARPRTTSQTRWVPAIPRPTALQPQDAWLILNYSCDASCPFCHIEGLKPLLKPLSRVREEISEARRVCSGERIGFSGGEPTLRKDLEEIFANATAVGFRKIHLYSHGRRFADENYALRLIKAGLSSVQISFHTDSNASNDKIMGLPRSEDTWRGIGFLGQNGVEVTVKASRRSESLSACKPVWSSCSLDAPISEFRITYPIIQRGALATAKLLLPLDEVVPEVQRLMALNGKVAVRAELIPLCSVLGPHFERSVEWRFQNQSDFIDRSRTFRK